jgi:hypothetical protein
VIDRHIAHFSENWGGISVFPVLGGNLLSIAFGRNLDAHEPPTDSSRLPPGVLRPTSTHQCLLGRECYKQSLYWNLLACGVALCLTVWAGRRDYLHLQQGTQLGAQMNVVEWEVGETDGSEESDA